MISLDFEKLTLSNGLQVVLHQDHTLPVVAVNLWYHVGSKNEEPGRTGFAHLFEHLMFEGSKNHNKDFFEPLWKVGGNLNGSTDQDKTNYWENVPSNALELALWLESDRMGFLLDALTEERMQVQRDVVKNERRQSYENRPYGMALAHIQEALYPLPHPYHWLTIGSPEDLDAASLEDVEKFFRRYYAPSNCSLSISGDFDRDEAERLVRKYFEEIPPGEPLPRMNRRDSDLTSQVVISIEDKVSLPRVYLAWPTAHWRDADTPALSLLSSVLGDGKSSRLYKSMVYDDQIAQTVNSFFSPSEIAGEFYMMITGAPGVEPERLRDSALRELERMQKEPASAEELERAKNRVESRFVRRLQRIGGFGGRADQLNRYNVLGGDPGMINTEPDRYMAVTADDMQRVANTALGHHRVDLTVLPESSLSPTATGVDRTVMPESTGQPTFTAPVPQRAKLPNGMDLVVVEKRELPVVAFGLFVHGGGTSDPMERPGLSYMTASMLDEGTLTRSSQQIADEFEFLGTQIFSSPRREHMSMSTESLTRHWPKALELAADLLRNPTFPEFELVRVLREHTTDLQRVRDDATSLAGRVAPMLLYGPQTPYGHPLSGTETGLAGLSRDELQRYYQETYRPGAATLLVVGDVSMEEAVSRAEDLFGDWRDATGANGVASIDQGGIASDATQILLLDKPGAPQSVIRAGHPSIPRSHPDYFALSLVSYVLGGHFSSRLNKNLREEKGYTYGYRSWIEWHRPSSLLMAGGGVQTPNTGDSVLETIREMEDIRRGRPITPEELTDARDGTIRGLPETFATPDQILGQLGEIIHFDLPDTYFSDYAKHIEGITLDDARRVAEERVDDDKLSILVVGDRETVQPQLEKLGLPIVHVDAEGNTIPE